MEKQDLETGMIVKDRARNWYLVNDDKLCLLSDYETYDLYDFYTDLTSEYEEELDIMLVANLPMGDVLYYIRETNENIESDSSFELIWNRNSEKEAELEKVITDLEKQLKDAKEELNRIKGE